MRAKTVHLEQHLEDEQAKKHELGVVYSSIHRKHIRIAISKWQNKLLIKYIVQMQICQ